MGKKWTLPIESDPDSLDELIISFPDEMMAELGWEMGDTLRWMVGEDGKVELINLTKQERDE